MTDEPTRKSRRGHSPADSQPSAALDEHGQNFSVAAEAVAGIADETTQTIQRLRQTKSKIAGVWQGVLKEVDEAEVANGAGKTIRTDILKADMESVIGQMKTRTRDLGVVMAGMAHTVKDLGLQIDELKMLKTAPEDQKKIDAAQAELDEAKAQLLQSGSLWLESRRRRAKANAEAAIRDAEEALQQANAQAVINAREKLKDRSIDQNLDTYLMISDECIHLMQEDVKSANFQLEIADAKLGDSFQKKKLAGRQLEEATKNLQKAEKELAEEERILAGMSSGTEEYTDQEMKVSNLRMLAKELTGLQLMATTEYESREKFTSILEGGVLALTSQRDDLGMYITAISAESEDRRVSFQNFLQIAKNTADLQMADNVDTVGASTDLMLLTASAQAMVASGKKRLERLASHPKRMQDIHEVTAAMAEHLKVSHDQFALVLDDIKRKYGQSELEQSYLQGDQEKAATA